MVLVRRQPLHHRLATYPIDFYYAVLEQLQCVEWDNVLLASSKPFTVLANLIFISCKLYKEYETDLIQELLLLTSLSNALYLWKYCWKPYFLFKRNIYGKDEVDTSHIPRSKHAALVDVNLEPTYISHEEEDEPFDSQEHTVKQGWLQHFKGLFSTPSRRPTTPESTDDEDDEFDFIEKRWQIKMWNPPKWSLRVFCWFSPPQAIFYFVCDWTSGNWIAYIFISLVIGFTLTQLVTMFLDLLQDKQVLHEEMVSEYSYGFVYKQPPFRSTSVAAVDTSDLSSRSTPITKTGRLSDRLLRPSLYENKSPLVDKLSPDKSFDNVFQRSVNKKSW